MKKAVIALVLAATMTFTNSLALADGLKGKEPNNPKFTDIETHWAKDSIIKVIDKDAFADKDGKYQPNKAITRSEFVLALHKALDIHIAYFKAPDIKEYFNDVKNEDVYAAALYDLTTLNIIDCKGSFNPKGTLTREEMVHYIMNAYKYKLGDQYKMIKIAPKPFSDSKKMNPDYTGDIVIAEYLGFIKRPVSNHFYPTHNTTRGEMAAVIDRLLIQLEKEKAAQIQIIPAFETKDGALTGKLTIKNNSGKQIKIQHSSGQQFDFQLLDSKKEVLYTWSMDKLFIMALTETVIEPGKSVEFTGTFEKAVMDNLKGRVAFVKAYIVGKSTDFTINGNGYEIQIK